MRLNSRRNSSPRRRCIASPAGWNLAPRIIVVGAAPLVSLLNQAYDPEQQRFKPVLFFEFYQERQGGPILTRTNQTGPFAAMKFTGALPRAKLYTDWQVANYDTNTAAWVDGYRKIFPPGSQLIFDSLTTNDQATVELMMRKSFEPAKTVLLAEPLATAPLTNAPAGHGGICEL
jgi:hypothetical protein